MNSSFRQDLLKPAPMDRNIRTIEIEVKHEAGDDVQEGLLSSGEPLPVEVNIDHVKRENESEEETVASSHVAIKEEVDSDEEELQPPAIVNVEGFKDESSEDMILPGNSLISSQTGLFPGKSGLQLQWKNQQGQILLHDHLSGNIDHLVDGKNLLVAPLQGSCSSLTTSDNQTLQNNVGTLVGDSNVQYVYLTPVDSLYYVDNPENIAVCQNDGNVKQVASVNNNLQIINISADKSERSVNAGFQSMGKGKTAIPSDNLFLSQLQSGERKLMGEAASSLGVDKCEIINELVRQQGEVGGSVIHAVASDLIGKTIDRSAISMRKVVPTIVGEKDPNTSLFLRKGCDESTCVMNCSLLIPEERRREINRIFCLMNTKERKKYILQLCSKKVVLEKAIAGTVRTVKHYRIDFSLQTADGKRVQVCRLFFFTTLGFGQTMFDNYLSSIFPSPETESFLPLSCKCIKGLRSIGKKYHDKVSECQLHSKITSHAHKDIFHNHIEGFLKTISIPDGDRLRTVRYLPKDISFNDMYEDFSQKHPDIPSTFEMYRNFIILFTS